MSDLIERLRRYEKQLNEGLIEAPYLGEAADEIERLRAALGGKELIERLRTERSVYDAELCDEAAEELERLNADLERLRNFINSMPQPTD